MSALDIEDLQRYVANSHEPGVWSVHDAIKHEGVLKEMTRDAAERLAAEMSALALSIPLTVRAEGHRWICLFFDATSDEDAYDPEPDRPHGQVFDHCDNCRTIWQVEMIQQNPDYSWVCPLCYIPAEPAPEA
jgi:hypothetical protein